MNVSRLKSFGKLVVLIGLPVGFVVGLFGVGVHVGYEHRAAILGFERDWLGRDVVVPGEPPRPAETPTAEEEVKPAEPPKPAAEPAEVTPPPTPEAPETTEAKPAEPPKPEPTPTQPEPPAAAPTAVPVLVAEPEALPPDLLRRLGEPVKVRVKVVVDAELFDRRRDWIDHAERQIGWASQVLTQQLGVELELRGVVAWPATWSSGQAGLGDLGEIGSDGADLVLGLGGRDLRGLVQASPVTTSSHARSAIAFADPSSPAPHLRAIVRAVSTAMGNDPIVADAAAISFTAEGRRALLERKHLPFAPEPALPADGVDPEGDN